MSDTKKVALVLGAVKGIGKAIAMDLLQRGIRVAATWFDWPESQPTMQADFESTGTAHLILHTNLLDTAAIADMMARVVDRFGRLDILINNIERGGWPVVHGRYIPEQWDLELATTLRAKRWVFEAALPHLKASGHGAVVNLSSIAGIVGRSGPASYLFNEGYAAANRGISLLTETWARLGAPRVRVNELMLGVIETRHGRYPGMGTVDRRATPGHFRPHLVGQNRSHRRCCQGRALPAGRSPVHDRQRTAHRRRLPAGGRGNCPMPEGVV